MNKKGFTLVELMVVIIIMGLLAAMGVPKLIGVIAKSRAAEVQPAAAAYVKLQKAYMGEKGGVGTWEKIGYAAPGKKALSKGVTTYETDNFSYGGEGLQITETIKRENLATALATAQVGWIAKNLNKLNGCASGNRWVVKVSAVNDTTVLYKSDIADVAASCVPLITSWGLSDNGITFKDAAVDEYTTIDPPDDIKIPTAETDEDEDEGFKVDVEAALSCHNQGWLTDVKKEWLNSYPECFKLRQLYFTNGILSCTGNDLGEQTDNKTGYVYQKCTAFSYTDEGKCKIFGEGCPEKKDNNENVEDKNKVGVTCPTVGNKKKYQNNNKEFTESGASITVNNCTDYEWKVFEGTNEVGHGTTSTVTFSATRAMSGESKTFKLTVTCNDVSENPVSPGSCTFTVAFTANGN